MIPMNVYPASSVVPIFFNTFDSNDPSASVTITGLAVTDIEIYKGTSMTQRASDAGYTLLDTDGIDLDGITGIHGFSIDLGDNTDAGFYAVGSFYTVVVSAITVDGATINFIADRFRIVAAEGVAGYPKVDAQYVEGSDATDQINAAADTALTDYDAPTKAELDAGLAALNDLSAAEVNAEVDTALADVNLDHLVGTAAPANPPAGTYLDILADDGTATYDRTTDSLQAIRDRGDTAWITGGGGGITDILNLQPVIPNSIDLANTATVRLGLMLTNALDDLPSTAEITPGTISIERKAIGGTSWSAVVTDAACSEQAGMIYYDEVFDSGTGYAAGDSIRVTFKSQKITVSANDYEITDANGVMFQTYIREAMRGTDSAATASALATAQADLDTLTGTDGATLATSQPNYAPATAAALSTHDAKLDIVDANVDTLLTRITATLFSGITALGEWLGLIAGKQAGDATALTEIKATGAGSGTFDPTTDSIEALRDTAPMGTAMRGTDSAALASVCTEARLAELDAANLPTDVDAILVDTADMQPKLGTPAADVSADIAAIKAETAAILTDTGTTLDAKIDAIKAITDAIGATAAANLAKTLSATGVISGTASGTPTTTTIPASDLASSVDDFYNGRVLLVTSGALAGQVTDVTDYTGSTKTLTVTAMTAALTATDTFILI